MTDLTWVEQIERLASGEPIESVRFGKDLRLNDDDTDAFAEIAQRSCSWLEAREWIDRGEEVDAYWTWALIAWTPSWVIFTHDYDTFREFRRLPRNPDGEWDGEVIE